MVNTNPVHGFPQLDREAQSPGVHRGTFTSVGLVLFRKAEWYMLEGSGFYYLCFFVYLRC